MRRTVSAREEVALGDAIVPPLSDTKKIATLWGPAVDPSLSDLKLHANWGRSPAQQLWRVLVNSDLAAMGFPSFR